MFSEAKSRIRLPAMNQSPRSGGRPTARSGPKRPNVAGSASPAQHRAQASLRDALQATPSVRFRVGDKRDGGPASYAITGRAGRRGYLQRIAVHPDERRHGWGRALVYDALRWLRRHDARRALVNTQWENEGALALYEACAFRRLPVGLCVLNRAL